MFEVDVLVCEDGRFLGKGRVVTYTVIPEKGDYTCLDGDIYRVVRRTIFPVKMGGVGLDADITVEEIK